MEEKSQWSHILFYVAWSRAEQVVITDRSLVRLSKYQKFKYGEQAQISDKSPNKEKLKILFTALQIYGITVWKLVSAMDLKSKKAFYLTIQTFFPHNSEGKSHN